MGNLNSFKNSVGDSVVLTGLGIAQLVEGGGGIIGGGEPHVQRKGDSPRGHTGNGQQSKESGSQLIWGEEKMRLG